MKKYLFKYSLEFLVIVMGISISFFIEKRNAKDYQEELKNQSLKRIIKNIEVDIKDLKFNFNVQTIASNATDWLVKNNTNYSNISQDSIGIYLNNAILLNTIFVDNQEEYRALQNSGLIELIENEKAVTALQNKYMRHEFYKKIEDIIIEETSFLRTLDQGLIMLDTIIETSDSKEVSGKKAFELYDTFGFPVDLTALILREKDINYDVNEFDSLMLDQKNRSKAAINTQNQEWISLTNNFQQTEFLGYDNLSADTKISTKQSKQK